MTVPVICRAEKEKAIPMQPKTNTAREGRYAKSLKMSNIVLSILMHQHVPKDYRQEEDVLFLETSN